LKPEEKREVKRMVDDEVRREFMTRAKTIYFRGKKIIVSLESSAGVLRSLFWHSSC
jgi:hypothetical protein